MLFFIMDDLSLDGIDCFTADFQLKYEIDWSEGYDEKKSDHYRCSGQRLS